MESTTAIDATVHRAAVRGHADLGWLDSYRTFSFGRFYDPERLPTMPRMGPTWPQVRLPPGTP